MTSCLIVTKLAYETYLLSGLNEILNNALAFLMRVNKLPVSAAG
jgi:hypothetical protein